MTHVHLDTEEGLVTVSGVADVSILIKAIKKAGRKAVLCKFEMQPEHQPETDCKETDCNKAKHTNGNHTHDGDHSDTCSCCDDDGDDVSACNFNGHEALGSSVAVPGYHYPQLAMQGGNAGYLPGSVPTYPYARPYKCQCAPPMVYGRPPPHHDNCCQQCPPQAQVLLPPSCHGELKYSDADGAVGNSLVYTFSDMNVEGCTIT